MYVYDNQLLIKSKLIFVERKGNNFLIYADVAEFFISQFIPFKLQIILYILCPYQLHKKYYIKLGSNKQLWAWYLKLINLKGIYCKILDVKHFVYKVGKIILM